ncbi:MAG: MFS transporter [Thermoplasmatota archaeon]|nr:MFS transporter [Candidatus Thermoplasmatota archaeon]MBU1915055.1 MFS transporter [Candidatus Thermoplasmatota archaeon]
MNTPDEQRKTRIKRRIFAGISTNVLVLGIVSLLTDMSSEMIYPILPLFLTAIGATGLVIGLIEGASETTASMVKVISGWYSDRYRRRKPFILGGYATSTAVKPLLYLATAPWHVFGLRVAERVGKGIRSAPRDALIADSTDQAYWGRAFGFHKAMDSTGAVLGPILILPVLIAASTVTEGTYRLIFLLSTIPAFLAVVVIFAFVRDKEARSTRELGKFFKEMRHLGRPFYLLMAVVMVFYIGEISYAFFILRAYDEGFTIGAYSQTVSTTMLYILYNVVFVLVAIPAGDLSDKVGRKPVIAFSFSLFAITSALMASANTLWLLGLGFVMFGVYKGSSEGVFKAYVTDVAPSHLRGTALGAFHTSVGLVMLPGGIVAGLLWDSVGHWATFAYGLTTSLVALLLLIVLRVRKADITLT